MTGKQQKEDHPLNQASVSNEQEAKESSQRKRKREDKEESGSSTAGVLRKKKKEDLPPLYGKLVKKPLQNDQLIRTGDEKDAITTWEVFQDLIPDLAKKARSWSKRSKVRFVKKPGQQDAPFDLEPLVTHLGQMIDGGEFDPPFCPPRDIQTHRERLRLALRYIREMRLSFTKHKFVDLMNYCDAYVSAIIEFTDQGMLSPDGKSSDPDPLLVAKCRRYLSAAELSEIKPLPPF